MALTRKEAELIKHSQTHPLWHRLTFQGLGFLFFKYIFKVYIPSTVRFEFEVESEAKQKNNNRQSFRNGK